MTAWAASPRARLAHWQMMKTTTVSDRLLPIPSLLPLPCSALSCFVRDICSCADMNRMSESLDHVSLSSSQSRNRSSISSSLDLILSRRTCTDSLASLDFLKSANGYSFSRGSLESNRERFSRGSAESNRGRFFSRGSLESGRGRFSRGSLESMAAVNISTRELRSDSIVSFLEVNPNLRLSRDSIRGRSRTGSDLVSPLKRVCAVARCVFCSPLLSNGFSFCVILSVSFCIILYHSVSFCFILFHSVSFCSTRFHACSY